MTKLNNMYKGVANSPDTFLTSALAIGGTTMYVADSAVFGELPNLAVLGSGANAETVLIKSKKADDGLEIERGIEKTEKKWEKATVVARNFTNYDYEQLKENIKKLNDDKVDRIDGKGLSTNDYDNIAKSKVDGIPSDPKYTDTVYDDTGVKEDIQKLKEQDLSVYAKKTDIKTKLSELEQDTNHRTLSDTEKAKVQAIPNDPKYTDTITEIVDNLTSNDSSKALSANQGVIINNRLEKKADKSDMTVTTINIRSNITAFKYGRIVMIFFNAISGSDVRDVAIPSNIQPIINGISFYVEKGEFIEIRNGKFNTSAADNTVLGFPAITYISRS